MEVPKDIQRYTNNIACIGFNEFWPKYNGVLQQLVHITACVKFKCNTRPPLFDIDKSNKKIQHGWARSNLMSRSMEIPPWTTKAKIFGWHMPDINEDWTECCCESFLFGEYTTLICKNPI